MEASDRFQGFCLQSQDGSRFMQSAYDRLPPDIRSRLQNSSYNLCVACVLDIASQIAGYNRRISGSHYLLAIQQMEAAIRADPH